MSDLGEHRKQVSAWLARTSPGLTSEELCQLFEKAFTALWRRANYTLSDITLSAILDRVLFNAAEQEPTLCELRMTDSGLDFQSLRAKASGLMPDQLKNGMQLVLAEFISVLANLTADILSASLHTALAKVDYVPCGRGTSEPDDTEEPQS